MTLPEHGICSWCLAQFGMRQRFGRKGVAIMVVAGISPDFDVAAKVFEDRLFWKLHHALGHGLVSLALLAAVIASVAQWGLGMRPWRYVFGWCLVACGIHALTDSLYWFPVKPLWPFSDAAVEFDVLEYLDLIVLAVWLAAALILWFRPLAGKRIAGWTFAIFGAYVGLRALTNPPTGWFRTVTGNWMYELPSNLPLIDWW